MRYRKIIHRRRPHRRAGHTYKQSGYSHLYFDTFQMELLLDRLHELVNIMEGINRLNRTVFSTPSGGSTFDNLRDSLDTIGSILPGESPKKQLSGVSNMLGIVNQMGGLQGMAESMAPMIKALSSGDNGQLFK